MGQRWGYEQSRMCGEVWISGQVRDGTGRWEAGCVLVKGELTDGAPEDIVARLPDSRCPYVALVMLSRGASVAVFRAASFALTLTPRARTELNTGASGLVASGLVASTWKPAIFALIVALILAEAEGGLRRELESGWCSGSPCVSI